MLETHRAGAHVSLPPLRGKRLLDSELSARADDASRSQERWSRRTHGSLSRPRRRSARNVDEREPERRVRPSFSRVKKLTRGPRRFRSPWNGPRACGAHRSSEEPTFRRVVLTIGSMWQKSDERRRRRGRAQHRETVAACRSETQRGKPRGASARPPDGRRSGSSVLAAIVTDLRKRVISAARSQTPLAHPKGREGGLLPQAKATRASAMRRRRSGGQAVRGDGSVRG